MGAAIDLKANLGRRDSQREEEMTTDEDGKDDREDEHSNSDVTEPPTIPKAKLSRGNMKKPRTGQTRVPKKLRSLY